MKNILLFLSFIVFGTVECMQKKLKNSSEMIKSLCEHLNGTDQECDLDRIISPDEQKMLEPYLIIINSETTDTAKQSSKQNLVTLLHEKSGEELNKITHLADFLHIPPLLEACLDTYCSKLLEKNEIRSFEKNPSAYLEKLNLPETLTALIGPNYMNKHHVTNALLLEKIKSAQLACFNTHPDLSKKYVMNNSETKIAIERIDGIMLKDLTNTLLPESGRKLPQWLGFPCFFSQKDTLLICKEDDELRIVDLINADAEPIAIHQPISIFDTSANEQLLAGKSEIAGYLLLYNLRTGYPIILHEIPKNIAITAIKIHPNNLFIFTGHANGAVYLWKTTDEKPHLFHNHSSAINDIDFNHNGSLMATGGQDQAVCLWDLETGIVQHRFTQTSPLKKVMFHPNADLIATLNQQSIAIIYEMEQTKKAIVTCKPKQTDRTFSGSPQIRWSKNGNHLTCVHKTLHTHIVSIDKTDDQWNGHVIFSGLPISEKYNSSPDMRLSRHGSHALIYQKEKKPTHQRLDLATIPQLRKEITHSVTLAQALGLAVWHKNNQVFNQRPEMRALIENADDLIKKHLGLVEQ